MSCSAYAELDLVEYLVEPRAPRWSAFRAHYPLCAACSATLSRLTRMEDDLSRLLEEPDAHPSPQTLLAYLAGEAQGEAPAETHRHLEGCGACRAELAAVRTAEALLAAPADAAASQKDREAGRARGFFGWLLDAPPIVPAIAVGALLLFVFFQLTGSGPDGTPEVPRIAQQAPSDPPLATTAPTVPEAPDAPAEALALEDRAAKPLAVDPIEPAPAPVVPEPPGAAVPIEPSKLAARSSDPPTPRAPSATPEAPAASTGEPSGPSEGATAEREVVLLAALDPSRIPSAAPRLGEWAGATGELAPAGIFRNLEQVAAPGIAVVAPKSAAGLTHETQPTLYWALARATRRSAQLTITPLDGIDPLITRIVRPPLEAGLHAFPLADGSVSLEAGRVYLFEVSLLADDPTREREVSSSALIRVVRAEDVEARLAQAPPEAAAHALAEAGLWLDAFARSQAIAEALPEADRARTHRDALLSAVGLGQISSWLGDDTP